MPALIVIYRIFLYPVVSDTIAIFKKGIPLCFHADATCQKQTGYSLGRTEKTEQVVSDTIAIFKKGMGMIEKSAMK